MGSGRFDYTEPSLLAVSQGKPGVDGHCTRPGGSSTCSMQSKRGVWCFTVSATRANLSCAGVDCNFTLVPGGSPTTNLLEPLQCRERKVCRGCVRDYTEPSLAYFLAGEQGMEGTCTRVPGGAAASNLLEPKAQSRERAVFHGVSLGFGIVRLEQSLSKPTGNKVWRVTV